MADKKTTKPRPINNPTGFKGGWFYEYRGRLDVVVEGVVDDVGYYDRAIKTEILAALDALSSEGT